MTMSSSRVDCCFCTTLNTARLDLPGVLIQPGRMLSSFSCGQIGVDADAAVAVGAADLADQLDRNCAGHRGAEIEAEPRPAGVIERRLQFDIGVALVRLAIIERRRWPLILTSPLT